MRCNHHSLTYAGLITLLLLAGATAHGAPKMPTVHDALPAAAYLHAHQPIRVVHGRTLDLFCVGKGRPVVLFVTGLGSEMFDWRFVQGPISKITTACAYNRAGYGLSGPPMGAVDANSNVADLHRLITNAHIPGPVVLVGHSIGGLYASLYAATYPRDVAGMVLVDPSFGGQTRRLTEGLSLKEKKRVAALSLKTQSTLRRCIALAEAGAFRDGRNKASPCLDNPPDPDPAIHHALMEEHAKPALYSTLLRETISATSASVDGESTNDREMRVAGHSFGTIPLTVLTAGAKEPAPGASAAVIRASKIGWKAGHDALASRSTRGVSVVVPGSGHFIQLDRPKTVSHYVAATVRLVRAEAR